MKVKRLARLSYQAWGLAVVFLASALLVAVAAACGGEEEETPTGNSTPAVTGSPSATVAGTATPGAATTPSGEVPGISDTEILLGAEVILSGDMGAVFATIPKATNAYFNYINETEGGVCGRKIMYKYEDNFDDASRAVEVARKLVEQDKVFAMVGSLGDAPHPASWEYLNDKGVPDILVSAGGHRFGADPQGHPWTAR
jgi:branched-chain amino acid transport system substrate-binding protein